MAPKYDRPILHEMDVNVFPGVSTIEKYRRVSPTSGKLGSPIELAHFSDEQEEHYIKSHDIMRQMMKRLDEQALMQQAQGSMIQALKTQRLASETQRLASVTHAENLYKARHAHRDSLRTAENEYKSALVSFDEWNETELLSAVDALKRKVNDATEIYYTQQNGNREDLKASTQNDVASFREGLLREKREMEAVETRVDDVLARASIQGRKLSGRFTIFYARLAKWDFELRTSRLDAEINALPEDRQWEFF